jgi:hypothetical protein
VSSPASRKRQRQRRRAREKLWTVDGEAITRIGDVRPGGDAPEMTIVTNSAAGDDPR